jgi:hypothetical protein
MTDFKRFRHIRNFRDIKLEKSRLRYDMLLAENQLLSSLHAIQGLVSLTSLLSRFAAGFSYAQRMLSGVSQVLGWLFGRKKKQERRKSPEPGGEVPAG